MDSWQKENIVNQRNFMAKQQRIIFGAFPFFLVMATLAGCAKSDSDNAKKSSNSPDGSNKILATQAVKVKTLALSEYKCTGCGKCVRIDAEHFAFNSSNRKAIVASTANLSSSNLAIAVSSCQVRAIELI
jgi:hypothetical protein